MKQIRSLKMIVGVISLCAVVVLFSIFAYQNSDTVSLRFLGSSAPKVPLFLILIVTFLSGMLACAAVCLYEILRLSSLRNRLEKQVSKLQKEVTQIRNEPLLDNYSGKSKEEENKETKQPAIKEATST